MTNFSNPDRAPLRFAMGAFFVHWSLALLAQIEGVWLYGDAAARTGQGGFDLVIAQGQNILVALLLALCAFAGAARTWSRTAAILLITAANIYVALNVLSIKLFASHFRFSFAEGPLVGGEALWDSIRYELDGVIYFNLALVALATAVLLYLASKCTAAAAAGGKLKQSVGRVAAIIAAAGVGLTVVAQVSDSPLKRLQDHPLIALWFGDSANHGPIVQRAEDAVTNLDDWRANLPPQPQDGNDLAERIDLLRAHTKTPNLILIVLESVGSPQLFPNDGLADPRITPHIARLQLSSVLFDALYSPFPGTVRSHVALATGGNTLTWGSVFHELNYPYIGPSLNRSFAELDYATALFSSQQLRFENMDGFYKKLDWDRFYEFGQLSEPEQDRYRLNSWGGEEFNTIDRIFAWISEQDHTHPFFVQYLTVATHHPYTAPDGYPGPASGDERLPRYQNALHYTDLVISKVIERLRKLGLADNTLVAVTGDHGQAFADRHPGNLTHKHFLYEENVKNFLLLYHPAWRDAGMISRRVGSIGDILPTLRALAGLPDLELPGRNLVAAEFPHEPVFFYKNAHPEKWGLRLGNWKYIATRDDAEVELYDLAADPTEQHSLAAQHQTQLGALRAAVQQWYLQTNDRFVAQLEDYHYIGGRGFTADDIQTFGPKIVSLGHTEMTDQGERFIEQDRVNPQENFIVWTKWVGYPEDQTVTYRFIGPRGISREFDFTLRGEWSTTRVKYDGPPMIEGQWRVELWSGQRKLIEKSFTVDNAAPLFFPLNAQLAPLESAVGSYDDPRRPREETFFSAQSLRQTQIPVIWTRWRPFESATRLVYEWRSPTGRDAATTFETKKGWDQTWVSYEGRLPLEPGMWRVRIIEGETQRQVSELSFMVVPSH